jgi:hypothetical protein
MAFKVDKKEEKSLEKAQKDAEIVSEFAKDARNRREAEKISNKLEEEIEIKEYAVENVLDETKNNIRQTTKEAQKEIPKYTRMFGDVQEESIKTTREIAYNYIESQKEIINIYQSVWTPYVENVSRSWNYWWISPNGLAETYGTVATGFADNMVSATRLTNNAISANLEVVRTVLQQTKDSTKEFSRLGVNTARLVNAASNDMTNLIYPKVEAGPRKVY